MFAILPSLQVVHRPQFDLRRGQERPHADIDHQAALDPLRLPCPSHSCARGKPSRFAPTRGGGARARATAARIHRAARAGARLRSSVPRQIQSELPESTNSCAGTSPSNFPPTSTTTPASVTASTRPRKSRPPPPPSQASEIARAAVHRFVALDCVRCFRFFRRGFVRSMSHVRIHHSRAGFRRACRHHFRGPRYGFAFCRSGA